MLGKSGQLLFTISNIPDISAYSMLLKSTPTDCKLDWLNKLNKLNNLQQPH